MTILIVDDKSENRYLLESFLKGTEYKAITAPNGKEALKILETTRVDLIISDILMPEMDGFQFCKQVKSLKKHHSIPFVFYSATFTSQQDEILALKLGASKFIRKPLEPEKFIGIIREILKSKESAQLQTGKPMLREETEILKLYNEQMIKKLEKKAKDFEDSELRYRAIFESTGTATMIVNEDTSIAMANQECLNVTGYTPEDLVSRKWTEFVAPDSLELMKKYHDLRRKEPGKAPKKYEVKLVNKSGQIRHVLLDIGMIPDTSQSVVSILDITEWKQAEEALRESEERYRAVVENSQNGILIVGDDFKFIYVNDVLCTILGCKREKIIGHDFREFLDEASKSLVEDIYKRRQQGENIPPRYEFDVLRENGEKRKVEISSTVLKGPQGRTRTIAQLVDITERKQAEEDLKSSEERLRILFEFAPDAYYLSDKKGTFIDGNKAAEDLLGFKREELIGKSFLKLKLLSTKQLLKASKLLLKNIQGKGTGPDEFIINRKDGSQVTAEIRTFPVKIKGKTFVLGIARDITERKKTEEEIRNLAKFPDENPNPVLRISKDGKVLYANKASQAILKSWKTKQGQLLTGKPMEFVRNVFQTKRQIKSEFELDARIFMLTFEPILPSNYVNIYGLDITELKLAEKELRKNQAAFENLYDHAPVGYHELDSQGRIIRINQTELNMLGYSKEEMLGKYIWEFAVNKEISEHTVKQKLNGILSNGHVFERSYRRKDGSVLPVVIEDRILHTDGGKISGVRTIVQDITEKKRLEEEKQDLENQFRESQKMESIGTLAGGIAHDFNNLLTVIQGHAQMAMMDMTESDRHYKNLAQIMNSSTRAASLTRQLLLFSRKEAIELKTLDLTPTIQNLLKMLTRLIGEDITINTKLAAGLALVEADEGNIEQMIMNLVVNARDAMPDGGTITITTENVTIADVDIRLTPGSRPGQFVRISVQDTGVGIPKELLNKIFDPFFSTKEKGKGIGLGLSVVYGIAKSHGGWINVYSEPEHGTVFKIYLPVSVSASTEKSGTLVESKESLYGDGENILIIEDERAILDLASSALRQFGYIVRVASDGQQAESIFTASDGNFRLIISDVVLPDINGYDLVNKLIGDNPSIEVIMCSGYTEERIKQSIIQDKGFRFLQKPYSMNELLIAVKEVISIIKN